MTFPATRARRNWLTKRDLSDANDWRPRLALFGFERIEYHAGLLCNDPELQDFLSLYRPGECCAAWNLAREGVHIVAWSASGDDGDRFFTMRTAIRCLLQPGAGSEERVEDDTCDESALFNVVPFRRLNASEGLTN